MLIRRRPKTFSELAKEYSLVADVTWSMWHLPLNRTPFKPEQEFHTGGLKQWKMKPKPLLQVCVTTKDEIEVSEILERLSHNWNPGVKQTTYFLRRAHRETPHLKRPSKLVHEVLSSSFLAERKTGGVSHVAHTLDEQNLLLDLDRLWGQCNLLSGGRYTDKILQTWGISSRQYSEYKRGEYAIQKWHQWMVLQKCNC